MPLNSFILCNPKSLEVLNVRDRSLEGQELAALVKEVYHLKGNVEEVVSADIGNE